MGIAHKALYNSLRITWLQDKSIPVEQWKVEDLRSLSLEDLFHRLSSKDIILDRSSFSLYAEQIDSPEELVDVLANDHDFADEEYDQVYLLVFELWRRLAPEKPTISILCDELDYQISLYDIGQIGSLEHLQDAIANIVAVLDENIESGLDPVEALEALNEWCANDIASFLYDYISEQLDEHQYGYAEELVDQFYPYVKDKRWFTFLKARLAARESFDEANILIREIWSENQKKPDLELNLDILAFMVLGGEYALFVEIVEQSLHLIHDEDDLLDLFSICADFFRCLDDEEKEARIELLIRERCEHPRIGQIVKQDPQVESFKQIVGIKN